MRYIEKNKCELKVLKNKVYENFTSFKKWRLNTVQMKELIHMSP